MVGMQCRVRVANRHFFAPRRIDGEILFEGCIGFEVRAFSLSYRMVVTIVTIRCEVQTESGLSRNAVASDHR